MLTSDPFVMCHRVKDGEEGDLSQSFGDRIYWSDVRLEGEKVVAVWIECEIWVVYPPIVISVPASIVF